MSLYYTLYANIHYKLSVYLKALDVLLVMFSIYGFLLILSGEQYMVKTNYHVISNNSYLLDIYKSLLPIYAFYVFARKGWLTEQTMKFWFFVFLILSIRFFYRKWGLFSLDIDATNNIGYSFVGMLPCLVVFYKKPLVQYILLVVCGFFIILGMKRGAMLSGGLCIAWFLHSNLKTASTKNRRIVIVVSLIVLLLGLYFVNYMMANNAYFQYRIDATKAGESSQRDVIYSTFYHHFINEDNPLRILLGNGANGTLEIGDNYAHNDWLEIAINQGFLGLFVYLAYWICLFISWRKTNRHPQAFMAIGMFFIIHFLTSLFSMSYDGVTRCAAMALGYYLAVFDKEEKTLFSI